MEGLRLTLRVVVEANSEGYGDNSGHVLSCRVIRLTKGYFENFI